MTLKITAGVVAAHFILLLFLAWSASTPIAKIPTPTRVHTVQLLPPPPPPKPAPKPTPKPSPKPAAKRKSDQLKPAPPKNDPMAAVRKSLNAIAQSRARQKEPVPPLPSHIALETPNVPYHEEVVAHLQKMLTLPEHGEVRIALTIAADGSVQNLKILSANNAKNQAYIEKELPLLHFPVPDEEHPHLELALRHQL